MKNKNIIFHIFCTFSITFFFICKNIFFRVLWYELYFKKHMQKKGKILLGGLFLALSTIVGSVFAASTDDLILIEDTFSAIENTESTSDIISESILLPIQQIGSGGGIIERTHEISICGNGIIEFSESCDKNNFGGKTCATYGKNSGSLSCSTNCKAINTSACVNALSPTPTPVPTIIPTANPTIHPTPSLVISGGGGGGGYNPIIWTTPAPTIGTLSNISPSPVFSNAPTAEVSQNSNLSTLGSNDPWLHNAAPLNPSNTLITSSTLSASSTSNPWLENGTEESLGGGLAKSGILPFEDWRNQTGIDALPASNNEAKQVTQKYISYVQSELEKKGTLDPIGVASMINGSINPDRQFEDSVFWSGHEACHYPWIWLMIAFLLGMLAEYLLYRILFLKNYEKKQE